MKELRKKCPVCKKSLGKRIAWKNHVYGMAKNELFWQWIEKTFNPIPHAMWVKNNLKLPKVKKPVI